MRHFRTFVAFIGDSGLILIAFGCETLGNHRRSADKDAPPQIFAKEPIDPDKTDKKTSFNPGSWSGEARDIEKNMMRNSANPNW